MGFSLWLEMGPKGTNKAIAPMGLGLIYQLLTSLVDVVGKSSFASYTKHTAEVTNTDLLHS